MALPLVVANNALFLFLVTTSVTLVIVTFGVPALDSNAAVFAITDCRLDLAVGLVFKSAASTPENV